MATPSPALPRIRSMDADGKRAWRVGRARRDRDDGHSRNSERTTCCSALSAWRRSCHGGGRGSRTRPGRTTATSRCASPSLLLHAHSPFMFAHPRTFASPVTVSSGMSTCTTSFVLQTACVVCQAVIFANLWKHHRLLPPTSPRKNYWDVVRAFPARPLHWPYEQHFRSSKLRAPSVLIPRVR